MLCIFICLFLHGLHFGTGWCLNPNLTQEQLFWRLHFTLGTCVFTMASSQALIEIAENDYDRKIDAKSVVDILIPYLAAGMSAKE